MWENMKIEIRGQKPQSITVTVQVVGVLPQVTHKSNKFPSVIAGAELAMSFGFQPALVIALPLWCALATCVLF